MRLGYFVLAVFMAGALLSPAPLATESEAKKPARKALLIANRAYKILPLVESAINDVRAIEAALRDVHFDVTVATDLPDQAAQLKRFDEFIKGVEPGDTALLYYVGHGVQVEEMGNFLLPLDFDPTKIRGENIRYYGYSPSRFLADLESQKAGTKIVFLDASRQLAGSWPRPGLATMVPAPKTGIILSTSPQKFSPPDDINAGASVFAQAVVNAMKKPGLTLPDFFNDVRSSISSATNGHQEVYGLQVGLERFYFRNPLPKPVDPLPPPPEPQTNVPKENTIDKQYYVWIPEGGFTMGCVEGDENCNADENLAHRVKIHGFWIGTTEVSVTTYERYAKLKRLKMPGAPLTNPGWKHGELPMMKVNWDQASQFCDWAKGRLPTEAEWEYAARGGIEGKLYPWGDALSHDKAKYNAMFGEKQSQDLWPEVAPVKSFDPNAWGLHDVVGNVQEWVADWYSPGYKPKEVVDPKGPATGDERVLRGGAYNFKPSGLRLSSRRHQRPEQATNVVGFRCVAKFKE